MKRRNDMVNTSPTSISSPVFCFSHWEKWANFLWLTQSMFLCISSNNCFNNMWLRLSMRVGSIQNQSEPRAWYQSFEHKFRRFSTEVPSNGTIFQVPNFHDVILWKYSVLGWIMVVSLRWVTTVSIPIPVHDSKQRLIWNWRWLPVWAPLNFNECWCLIDHSAILERKRFYCLQKQNWLQFNVNWS